MYEPRAESVNTQLFQLEPNTGYPEAISDPIELSTLLAYFSPYVHSRQISEEVMTGLLYNPLNIEYVARELLSIECPTGFSAREMQTRLDRVVPCPTCGDMVRALKREYIELGRCNWDCV